ncbi:MAG: PAS domain S-box protein [Methanococcaceae archaeon]
MINNSKTILLVEDEAIIALMENRWLTQEGFSVLHVLSGEKAIETVRSAPGSIDLILMDIDLGAGIDGTTAASEILKDFDLPLLFVSSHTEKEIVERTEKITSYGYVVKGSSNTVLLASIKMAFKLYEAHQELKSNQKILTEREFWLNESQKVGRIGNFRINFITGEWSTSNVLDEIFGIDENHPKNFESWLALIHPEDMGRIKTYFQQIVEEKGLFDAEYRVRRYVDGEIIFVQGIGKMNTDESGYSSAMIGTIQDITKRKLAEQALAESLERYRNTLDNMMEGCQIIDFNWNYVYINDAAAKHARLKKEILMGQNMIRMFPGVETTEMFSVLSRCMKERIPYQFENEFIYPGGSSGWFELNMQPVPEGVFILSIDITSRKQTNMVLEKRMSEFAILQQLASQLSGQFELKSLLSNIILQAATLLSAQSGGICLYNFKAGELELYATLDNTFSIGTRFQLAGGIAALVAESRKPVIINNDTTNTGLWQNPTGLKASHKIMAPMIFNNKLLGFIGLIANSEDRVEFTEQDTYLFKILATQASAAVFNKSSR